jgi:hypothetical protein
MTKYNDKLDADQQISTEEKIAAQIFDSFRENYPGISEDDAQQMGRDILLMVLKEFRPDLVDAS